MSSEAARKPWSGDPGLLFWECSSTGAKVWERSEGRFMATNGLGVHYIGSLAAVAAWLVRKGITL